VAPRSFSSRIDATWTGVRNVVNDWGMRALFAALVVALVAACEGNGTPAGPTASPMVTGSPTSAGQQPRRLAELPEPRSEVAGAAWAGGLVVVGGYREDGSSSRRVDLWLPTEDTWRPMPDLPAARNHPAAAVLSDRLYVSGGRGDGASRGSDQVWSLGPGERSWRAEPPLRQPRLAHAMAAVGGRLVVAGGVGPAGVGPAGLLTSVEILTARSWESGPPLRVGREHLGGVGSSGRFWAVAGRRAGLATNLGVVESWAPGEGMWRREPDLRTARGGVAAGERGGEVCVAGGEEPEGTIPTVECLRGGRWQVVARLAVPRHGLAVVGLPDGLHVVAGGPRPGLTVSGVHELL
jgi:hypothetical protein